VLENQLLAPSLKGVIDFDFVELLALLRRFFAPFRVGADEENQWAIFLISKCKIKLLLDKI
jgi:hypothetical protein